MRKVFRFSFLSVAGLVFLATVVMFFLAGVGAFDAAPRAESFEPHRLLGRGLFVLAVLAIGLAALARVPGRLIGLAALVAGLVVVQSLIAVVAGGFEEQTATVANLVFGLHALNGMVTMGVAQVVFMRARQLAAAPAPAAAAPVPAAS